MSRDSRAIVRVSNLLAIHPFISSEQTRYYLNGTHIAPHAKGGATLAATDGHALGVVYDMDGHVYGLPQIWLISDKSLLSKALATWNKLKPFERFRRGEVTDDDGQSRDLWADLRYAPGVSESQMIKLVGAITAQDVLKGNCKEVATITGEFVIDGNFPDYWRVVPEIKDGTSQYPSTAINWPLMERLIGLAKAMSTQKGTAPIRIYPGEEGAPAIAYFGADDSRSKAMAVVMPIRHGDNAYSEPAWVEEAKIVPGAEVINLETKKAA